MPPPYVPETSVEGGGIFLGFVSSLSGHKDGSILTVISSAMEAQRRHSGETCGWGFLVALFAVSF